MPLTTEEQINYDALVTSSMKSRKIVIDFQKFITDNPKCRDNNKENEKLYNEYIRRRNELLNVYG